jgi:uncharacterized membrane protein
MSDLDDSASQGRGSPGLRKVGSRRLLGLVLALLFLSCVPPFVYGQPGGGSSTGSSSARVYGVVMDVSASPLNAVTVTIYDSSGSYVTKTQTLLGGDFSVSLSSGSYRLELGKRGYEDKSVAFTVSKASSTVDLGDITLNYGLEISTTLTYLRVNCFSEVSIPMTVGNIGLQDEPVQLSIQAPAGWTAGVYSGENEVLNMTLGSGETQSLVLDVIIPYNSSGFYTVSVTASGWTIQECEVSFYVDKTNPEILTSTYPISQATPGSAVSFDLTIKNVLSKRFTGLVSVVLPVGWTGSVTAEDGSALYGISLDSGESLSAKVEADIPADEAPGDNEIVVLVKSADFESSLQLGVIVVSGAPQPKLSTDTPYVDAYAGRTASYSIAVKNAGNAEGIVGINVTGLPTGYSWSIKDSAGNELTKLYLKPSDSKTLSLTISVPPLAEPDIKSFSLEASVGEAVSRLNLGLGILGYYSISYVTTNFYLESTAGASGVFQVVVKNTGYSSLSNVELGVSDVPSQFDAAVEPSAVLLLNPQETATFSLTVTTNADINAGDYYITLNVTADQSEISARSLHVYVKQSGEVAYIGAGIAIALAAALYFIYRRYGRR